MSSLKKTCNIPSRELHIKTKEANQFIKVAAELAKSFKGGASSAHKNEGLGYTICKKVAQIITNSFFSLGLNTCAYIITKFPPKLREPVIIMLQKEAEMYAEKEKYFTEKEKYFEEKENYAKEVEKYVNGEESSEVKPAEVKPAEVKAAEVKPAEVKAAGGAAIVCARLKKQECVDNTETCLWKNSKCTSKEAASAWIRANLYTQQLIPEIPLSDIQFKNFSDRETGAKTCGVIAIKSIRIYLFYLFVNMQTTVVEFVAANLVYDLVAYIVQRMMFPNYKPKGAEIVVEYGVDKLDNYMKAKSADKSEAIVVPPIAEVPAVVPPNAIVSAVVPPVTSKARSTNRAKKSRSKHRKTSRTKSFGSKTL